MIQSRFDTEKRNFSEIDARITFSVVLEVSLIP